MNIYFLFFVLVSSLVQYSLCYLFVEKHGIGEGRDEPVLAYSKHLCGAATGLYYVHLDLHVTFITNINTILRGHDLIAWVWVELSDPKDVFTIP